MCCVRVTYVWRMKCTRDVSTAYERMYGVRSVRVTYLRRMKEPCTATRTLMNSEKRKHVYRIIKILVERHKIFLIFLIRRHTYSTAAKRT